MIIITGGAGMIGSMIAWHINTVLGREDVVIVDDIQHPEQWQNLVKRRHLNYLDKSELACFFSWQTQSGRDYSHGRHQRDHRT